MEYRTLNCMEWTKDALAGPTAKAYIYRTDDNVQVKVYMNKADDLLSVGGIAIDNVPYTVIANHVGRADRIFVEAVEFPSGEHVGLDILVGNFPDKYPSLKPRGR